MLGLTPLVPGARAAEPQIFRTVYQTDFMALPLSRSFLTFNISATAYAIEAKGRSSALLALLDPMKADATSSGALDKGRLLPSQSSVNVETAKKVYALRLAFNREGVADETISPPVDPAPDRVALTSAMKQGVLDPLSAFLVNVKDTSDLAAACTRTLPVYTGRERFDIILTPARTEARAIKGLPAAQALVCNARYKPVGGHRAEKKEVIYMAGNTDMTVSLVPLTPHVLVVAGLEVGTKIGTITLTLERVDRGETLPKKADKNTEESGSRH